MVRPLPPGCRLTAIFDVRTKSAHLQVVDRDLPPVLSFWVSTGPAVHLLHRRQAQGAEPRCGGRPGPALRRDVLHARRHGRRVQERNGRVQGRNW
jgi:hypothetical protein